MNEKKPLFFYSPIHSGIMLPFAKTESERKLRIRAYSTYIYMCVCVSLGDGVKKSRWL